jgi:hypothetical protein
MLLPSSMSEWVGPWCGHVIYFFIHESTARVSLGLLVVEISRSHWYTALGRTPLDERSARRTDLYLKRHKTVKTQTSIPPAGFRTHNPSKRADADLRLRPRGHWDRQSLYIGRMKRGDLSDLREKQRRQYVCGAERTVRPMMFLFMIHILYSAPHFCMTSSSWQIRIKFELWVKQEWNYS